jgi:regulator of cell morphogenesis and NO signaling
MTFTPDTTVRDIVAGDFRAAAVFQKHGIDFCCGGDRPLAAACVEQGVDVDSVIAEIVAACTGAVPGAPRYDTWDPPNLVSYIIANHHAYVRDAIPTLLARTQKVATVHEARHPELRDIEATFAEVADEMTSHMFKEEHILFPFIVAMADAVANGQPLPAAPFGSVGNPIRMMEHEHESAGNAMARIRELSAGYAPPDDACTTYRVCLEELRAFEEDLHTHVHLENNILFPKARALEQAG